MPRYDTRQYGPLPIELINAVLGTELEPATARLSSLAHRHIAEDHPDHYPICIEALAEAIATPTFIGQDPTHRANFVLVKRIGLADGRAVLVAIGLEPDRFGAYAIRSTYLISREDVEKRRSAGRLKLAPSR